MPEDNLEQIERLAETIVKMKRDNAELEAKERNNEIQILRVNTKVENIASEIRKTLNEYAHENATKSLSTLRKQYSNIIFNTWLYLPAILILIMLTGYVLSVKYYPRLVLSQYGEMMEKSKRYDGLVRLQNRMSPTEKVMLDKLYDVAMKRGEKVQK